MKMTAHQIETAKRALDRVKGIDDDIRWLGKDAPDKVGEFGAKMRNFLGQNRMGKFTNDELGEVLIIAVINRLLDKRAETVAEANDLVDFPLPPCPRQATQESEE